MSTNRHEPARGGQADRKRGKPPSHDERSTTPEKGGLPTGLQPGGTKPDGGPGSSVGSIGTGGGSSAPTGNRRTGKR